MLALARLQRKFRLVESPYRTPQTLVGGPRLDAALMAASGRTATTKAMGKGSTQHQHLVQTEVPPQAAGGLAGAVGGAQPHRRSAPRGAASAHGRVGAAGAPHPGRGEGKARQRGLRDIQDRRGRNILSVRDQNTFDGRCARSA